MRTKLATQLLSRLALPALLTLLAAPPLSAQGRTDRPNFEEVQVKPITVARVDGFDFLLVCNTPDDSLEIYSTRSHRLLFRLPTGQGPVSVAFHAPSSRLYTTNFFGDSITVAHLAASNAETIKVTLEQTTWVGDEPWHLVFYTLPAAGGAEPLDTLLVSHQTLDTIGWLDADTLQPIAPGLLGVHAETSIDLDGDGQGDVELALKEPRTLTVLGDQLVAIATKGGNSVYDNDVWCSDLVSAATRQHGGLGSSNTNLAADSSGNLYVVGGMARNGELQGEAEVASALTGFVQSMLYLVEDVCTDNVQIDARDLNAIPGVTASNPVTGLVEPAGVAQNESLAQPMDVALLESGGVVEKVYVAAFGIDRIGVLKPVSGQPLSSWPIQRIDVTPVNNAMAGPRGLAVKPRNPALENDRARLYVHNRLDNSVTVIDAATDTVVTTFALANDPRPQYVRNGLEFLFGAQHSGNHKVSCASCHLDARTDRLVWNLGNDDAAVQIPETLKDASGFVPDWPSQKGIMVTQTLQGLLNSEVDQEAQRLFTNAPYHWRADRNDFVDFNPAFVSLLGAASQLSPGQMARYQEYVHSILYPGNPKQGLERTFSGDFGPTNQADDPSVGSGAQHGMKLFHMVGSGDGRSCSHCHALPDGSNNMLTEGPNNPIEVAALRHVFQREGRVDKGRTTLPSDAPFSGITGLFHTGGIGTSSPFNQAPFNELDVNPLLTIDAFNRFFFSGAFCPTYGDFCADLQDLNTFVHEFDTGVASLAGIPVTFEVGSDPGLIQLVFDLMEGQAKLANVGVAVHVFLASGLAGYVYDPVSDRYQQVPPGPPLTRAGLVALPSAADERLVVQATPLGAERRIASPTGVAPPQPDSLPAAITMLPWRPNTAYENVPLMTTFWATFANPDSFYTHVVRLLQYGILQDAAAPPLNALGLTGLRHEAPRRVVIAGRRIQRGAEVHLFVPNDPTGPPDTTKTPEDPGQVATLKVALPLYPTGETSGELPVYQTAVEWAPLVLYKTMLGGDFAPGIQAALNDTLPFAIAEPPAPGTFDPVNWGFVYVRVVNPSGFSADAGWQRIVLSPPPP